MAPLYDRLVPILQVVDLQAERDFYVALGFTVSYEGPEFPDFVALAHGPLEFGIQQDDDVTPEMADRVLRWQFGVRDIAAAKTRLSEAGVALREEWVTPREDWKDRVLHARTPNGYHLMLEEQAQH
jgi:catechol 2,3-dioxygenase-like lactoylglutathione lyase family enzyme